MLGILHQMSGVLLENLGSSVDSGFSCLLLMLLHRFLNSRRNVSHELLFVAAPVNRKQPVRYFVMKLGHVRFLYCNSCESFTKDAGRLDERRSGAPNSSLLIHFAVSNGTQKLLGHMTPQAHLRLESRVKPRRPSGKRPNSLACAFGFS